MSTTAVLDKPFFETIMNAVIIYDDFACAAKANAMLEKALYRADEVTLWNVKPWRVDLLNLPPTAAEALRDTADAHLIVFALRPAQSLSVRLLDWLEHWAAHRQVGEAALAVFSGESGDAPSASAMAELSLLAERRGLNFIFDNGGSARDEFADFARLVRARGFQGSHSTQIMDAFAHQRWGINE